MLSILAESDFNKFADAIELSDHWDNHPASANIVDAWHAVHRADLFGHIVYP